MKTLATIALAGVLAAASACTSSTSSRSQPDPAGPAEEKTVVLDHELKSLTGDPVKLSDWRGKALLLVNTASQCGYTPQFAGLQELHERYGERGLVVVGIPSNDFGGQEPGDADEIATFCETQFGVSFPMMEKVHAKGEGIAPLYRTLTTETPEGIRGEVKWNFTKFLVDPSGVPVARFEPKVEPTSAEVIEAIEAVLPR